jgi:hypothetical protein
MIEQHGRSSVLAMQRLALFHPITGRELLISNLQFFGTFSPGFVFWLGQTPVSPRRRNPKPGNCFFSLIATNASPAPASWPPDFAASAASAYGVASAPIRRVLVNASAVSEATRRVQIPTTEVNADRRVAFDTAV